MSSEQVIAEREHYKALSALSDTDKLGMLRALRGDLIHEDDRWQWCPALDWAIDRLSTPAAGDVHSKPAISMQVRPDMSKESVDAIVEHLRTVREDHAADMIEQLQARNAEQALQLRFLLSERERAESKLTALLDGIEGLEAKWRGHSVINLQSATDAEIARAVNFTLCRDELLALREKANG